LGLGLLGQVREILHPLSQGAIYGVWHPSPLQADFYKGEPLTMTMAKIAITSLAAIGIVIAGCGSKPNATGDEKQLISEICKQEIKEQLRDPDSARFNDEEYIAKVKPDDTYYTGNPPPAYRSYRLEGTVRGGNGFSGMAEPTNYTCLVSFDKSGDLITGRTFAQDSSDDMSILLGYLQTYAIEPIITNTVEPDGRKAG
jgi:hypothetical protein